MKTIFQAFQTAYPPLGHGELPGSFEWDETRWVFKLNGEEPGRFPWKGHENAELRELSIQAGWPLDQPGLPTVFRVMVKCHHSHKSRPPQYTIQLLTLPPWKRGDERPLALDNVDTRGRLLNHRAWLLKELDYLFDAPDDPIEECRADRLMRTLGLVVWWMETRRPFTEKDKEQLNRMDAVLWRIRRCRAGECSCTTPCDEFRAFTRSTSPK